MKIRILSISLDRKLAATSDIFEITADDSAHLVDDVCGNSPEKIFSHRQLWKKGLLPKENSTVTLLLNQLQRESQRQRKNGDLKDGEYQEITERIGQIERAVSMAK
jgi:hypothetical protein